MDIKKSMILQEEYVDIWGNIQVFRHPVYSLESVKKLVRSYKVKREDGVELLYSCKCKNGCNGKGYLEWVLPSGFKRITSCWCVSV